MLANKLRFIRQSAPAITLLANSSAQAVSTTSVTCNVPSGVADGDLLVAATVEYDGRTWNSTTGWTQRAVGAGSQPRLQILTRIASSEPASYTFSVNSSTQYIKALIMAFRSVSYDTAGTVASTLNDSSTLVVPSITVASPNSLVLAAVGSRSSIQSSLSSMTQLINLTSDFPTLQIFYGYANSGSTGTRSFSTDTANRRDGVLVSISPL